MNSPKYIIALFSFIILASMIGCTQQESPPAQAEFGGTVLVDYVLVVNLTDPQTNLTSPVIYDTSFEDVARAAGIYNSRKLYEPLLVGMNDSNGLLPAFTRALVGMKEGENKTFVLPPSQAYGAYDQSKVFELERVYVQSRYEKVPAAYFESMNLSYEVGTELSNGYWNAEVVNFTNSSVTVKYYPELNGTFTYSGLPQRVLAFDDENITVALEVGLGKYYQMDSPSGQKTIARVAAINETTVVMDSNHALAGKDLEFTVFVRKIQKA